LIAVGKLLPQLQTRQKVEIAPTSKSKQTNKKKSKKK
jgi:hypothetical protein